LKQYEQNREFIEDNGIVVHSNNKFYAIICINMHYSLQNSTSSAVCKSAVKFSSQNPARASWCGCVSRTRPRTCSSRRSFAPDGAVAAAEFSLPAPVILLR
jgi:hypothetical protein